MSQEPKVPINGVTAFNPVHPPRNTTTRWGPARTVRPETATERAAREGLAQSLDMGLSHTLTNLWAGLTSEERAHIARFNDGELRAWLARPVVPRVPQTQSPGSLMPPSD